MKNWLVKIMVSVGFIGFLLLSSDNADMNEFYKSKIYGAVLLAVSIISIRIINAKSKYHKY